MTPETIDKLKEVFAPVADKIGQGAQFGWEIVLRQQIVTAIIDFITAGIFLSVTVAGIVFFWKMRNVIIDKTDGMGFLFSVFLILPALFVVLSLIDGLQHIINPAYYALQFFISLGGK